jgi:hypothetical protein
MNIYYAKGLTEYMLCLHICKEMVFHCDPYQTVPCFMQLRMILTGTETCVLLKQTMCLRSHAFFDSWKNFKGAQGSTQIFFCEISKVT